MPPETGSNDRSEIIHAVHGMTPAGNWFLLADVAPKPPGGDQSSFADTPTFDDTWLVVLWRRDRDIITLQGQDA